MNILNQLEIQPNNTISTKPTIYWQNTNYWKCICKVMFKTPYSGSLRHLCKECGQDVSRRLLLSKSMKLVPETTSFYSHRQTGHIESKDVLSWAELNWMVASGGLSKSFLERCEEDGEV